MRLDAAIVNEQVEAGTLRIPELCDLATRGLAEMFNSEGRAFCDTYNRTETGMLRQGLSHRYTMITLLGLHRYEQSGRCSPVPIASALDALLHDTDWIRTAGDLGLLLWTCAELAPVRLPEVYREFKAQEALSRFPDGQQGCTMEVAWYLTGLATCCLAGYSDLPGLTQQVTAARRILEGNCGPSGVYGHFTRTGSVRYVRGRFGSFADQVYPTIAFARLSRALQDEGVRQIALCTAKKMCELQGQRGEWSWQYDSASGRVASRYPVYSVHQHAMGPMMLLETGEATGCEFSQAIDKSLAWIRGDNELGSNFVEPSLGVVWRCIYLDSVDVYIDAVLRLLHLRNDIADARRVKVRYECRPYELGWLLYAFAGK